MVRSEQAGTVDGRPIERVWLGNARGSEVAVLTLGATLDRFRVPDARGAPVDLVLGFDTPEEYVTKSGHLGATVGRFANRIAHGRFTLDGKTYQLPCNQAGKHHLHGGPRGFAKRPWDHEVDTAGSAVRLTLVSPDGDAGYPGRLTASATYRLGDDDTLAIEMAAETDAPTIVNLVNHAYWNLAGTGTIDGHVLELAADRYLAVDADSLPTGEIMSVEGTPFDFRQARPLDHAGAPLVDHCFVLTGGSAGAGDDGLRLVARLADPSSGRRLTLLSDQPGVQVYTGFKLDTIGRGGERYGPRRGLCLETEAFPDAPNHPAFPSAVVRPGEIYRHRMVIRLG